MQHIYVVSLYALISFYTEHVESLPSSYKLLPEQATIVEDAVGVYELQTLREFISNSTSSLSKAINSLGREINDSRREVFNSDLRGKIFGFEEDVKNVQKSVSEVKGYFEEIFDFVKSSFKSMKSDLMTKVSGIKGFILDQTKDLKNSLRQSSIASRFILSEDCQDLYDLNYNASGAYWLQKLGTRVLCDMETDGGGWLIIQQRTKAASQVNFDRDWNSYKTGFGNLDSEFWIGNDILHIVTNQKRYELLIDMKDFKSGHYYAQYSNFRVGSESTWYSLDVGNYSGNASDAFTYHHDQKFTTKDRDHDSYDAGNCAQHFYGGWWYERCYDAHLNGIYPDPPDRKNASYISWWSRDAEGEKIPLVLTEVTMKIRPRSPEEENSQFT